MHLICPHCQSDYDLPNEQQIQPLLCHRCGHEFPSQQNPPHDEPSETESFVFPERQRVRLLPWLMAILTLIAIAGFWFQYDAWMDQRWLRSAIIDVGFKLPARDKDWHIVANSVHPSWITRNDGSKLFIIRAQLKNLLSSAMPPPRIEVTFFSKTEPNQRLSTQEFDITELPSERMMQHVPYQPPAINHKPIAALATRKFVIIMDKIPQDTGDFSLQVRSAKKR